MAIADPVQSIAGLKAATTFPSDFQILAADEAGGNYASIKTNGLFFSIRGYDFSSFADDDNVVAAKDESLTNAAWVRQLSSSLANRVTFITSGAAVDGRFRDVQSKLNDVTSVKDNGATGLNTLNDKAAINEISLNMPFGKDLFVPAGQYKFEQGGLTQTRLHSWLLEPSALIRGDYTAGQFDDLFVFGVTAAQADGEQEVRGSRIEGGRFLTFYKDNPNPGIVTNLDVGGYALTLSAVSPNLNIINFTISGVSMTGGKGALRLVGDNVDRTIAWSLIQACSLSNGTFCEQTADGIKFRDNICTGVKPAYTWDILPGAFCYTIDGGTSGNRDGLLDIKNASLWRVNNVQIEHSDTFAGSVPAYSSLHVRALSYPSISGAILLSNFGGGTTKVQHSIALENALGTIIDENYLNITSTSDVRIEPSSHGTIIGSRNMARGIRTRRATGAYTDVSRLLKIDMVKDGSGNVAKGCRGIWYKASDILVNLQNTWTVNELEIMLCETGLVVFNGGLVGGSSSGEICLFPEWLRPHQDAFIHCSLISSGDVRSLKVATNGVLSIIGSLSSSTINLANATYPAVTNVPYNVGP